MYSVNAGVYMLLYDQSEFDLIFHRCDVLKIKYRFWNVGNLDLISCFESDCNEML